MTQLSPYITFNGNCREAMTFYQQCFGGELLIQSVADSAVSGDFPAEAQDYVMHSQLESNDMVLMACDPLQDGELVLGNTIGLCLNFTNEEEIKTIFSKLSSGGQVTNELNETFWGAIFGQLTDKFGIEWMLNCEKKLNA
jgi:PhnB protein